ncbi:MAG: hypothetical protein HZB38_16145 [Planctomycetes bacterium]|nr:hypothetical protein [Planctomycetota bacterium]
MRNYAGLSDESLGSAEGRCMLMRKWMPLLVLVGSAIAASGCDGVVKTWDDRKFTYSKVTDMDLHQIPDDWDKFWLMDRQYRLTRWLIR